MRDSAQAGRPAAAPRTRGVGPKAAVLRFYDRISEHRVLAMAAGVTFYALLAIFPGLAALVSIYGLFADPATIAGHVDAVAGFAPAAAIDILRDELTRLAGQGKAALGIGFLVGLAVSLWSANSGMKALFDALNVVYGETEQRRFLRLNAVSLAFTLGTIAFLLLALVAIVGVPIALSYIGLAGQTDFLVRFLRWPILLAIIAPMLAAIYRYGPSRTHVQWRWITLGSACAALLWIAVSLLFSWYAANFASYNKTYGSLGAAVAFMTWIWISTIVILIGAEIDAQNERKR
jgi:membrane protein